MAFPVVLNGRTYTLADFEGTNYVDGLPDAFEDFVTHAGDIYNDTSTSSAVIGTGSKTFTVSSGKPYQAGTPLRIADAAAPATNFLDCIVTSYSGTSLVVNAFGFAGSGTKTSWTINIGGAKTVDGTLAISQGGTGATTAAAARTALDTYSKTEADSRFLNVSGEASDVTMNGNVTIGDAGTDTLTINAATTTTADISFGDNDKAIFGVGGDLSIYHDGSHSYIEDAAGTGNLKLRTNTLQIENAAGTELSASFLQDGAVTLYNDNTARLATTSTGIDVTGVITTDGITTSADINFGDNDKAVFGAGSDLQIFHSGTNSFIQETGTGDLLVGATNFQLKSGDFGESMLTATDDGAVTLFYNNASKLATTNTGIDVTGTVTADGLTVDGSATISGASRNITFIETDTTDVNGRITQNGGELRLQTIDDALSVVRNRLVIDHASGDISFYNDAGTSQDFYWDASTSRLGLGTTAPAHEIHINSDSPQIRLEDTGGTNTYADIQYNGVSLNIISRGGASAYGAVTFARTDGTSTFNTAQINAAGDYRFFDDTGTERMRWDASASSLGLGVPNPTSTLDIVAPTNYGLKVRDGTYTGVMVPSALGGIAAGTTSNHPFILLTNNTERMRVTSTGIDVTGSVTVDGGTFEGELLITGGGSGTILVNDEDSALCPTMTFTRNGAGTTTNDFIKFKNSGGEVAAINSFGGAYFLTNVGIGTSAPIHRLSVDSSNRLWNVNDDGLANYVTTSATNTSGSVVFYRQVADRFHFGRAVDGTDDKLIIDSSGNLIVGTSGNANSARINVQGASGARPIDVRSGLSSGSAITMIAFYDNASDFCGQITINADANTTQYVTSSDYRLKENIVDAPSASDDIDAIQVRSFDWKADGSHQKYGMVAQELNTVAPDAVSAPEDPEEMMGVDYSKLVPMLVKEIQSLRARVAQLEGAN